MKISIVRETLLSALQAVANVVERRQTLPILSNVLVLAEGGTISVTASDMEVEASATVVADVKRAGSSTVPGKKLLDICRALPPQCEIAVEEKDNKIRIVVGRSRFSLGTLPPGEFPVVGVPPAEMTLTLDAVVLRDLIAHTHFAMAHQDVRYYLNGLLLEVGPDRIKSVATDGHRLAVTERKLLGDRPERQLIVPRKGVTEIQRLATHCGGTVSLGISPNIVRVMGEQQSITIKLVDGKFPDYERVLPKNASKVVLADREATRLALQRTSILSNEKFRGVRLQFDRNTLKASAHNPEQEEAEEEIAVRYEGESLEIGFNVSYLLDVLNVLDCKDVEFQLADANSSCLIQNPEDAVSKYVVMPMRL